ncbi:MAG: class I SAM-dependent methyltransferase [Euryhalocaulis sp.]|uniref:class I SAM-dependent methyltransferase n=1 Tax=Euryhalocaulis sp. TaxID=2744307 RepID=UPI001858E680|nr:class I SAM-dependent methyltransferase [Euryhalocaulis sp.]MBA4801419.1 class I SAM-dependent methyltransferase [Euryhalocaulis sp.]
MSFYENRILPHLIGLSCSQKPIMMERAKVLPHAEGRVLEVGLGAGPNLPLYNPAKVTKVIGLEPSAGMRRKAAPAIAASPVPVELIGLPGEEIPLDDDSVDTVVLTYTLCTIPDFNTALAQMRRVLKPGGRLLFSEHGAAPDPGVAKWQRRIEPLWKRIAGGCHLTRPIPKLIEESGFAIGDMEAWYLPGAPKIAGFNYRGFASIR